MIILLFSVLFGVILIVRRALQDSGEFCGAIDACAGDETPKDHESKAPDLWKGFPVIPPRKPDIPPHSPAPDASGAFFLAARLWGLLCENR